MAAVGYVYDHHIKRLATSGPFYPPEMDGKENIVHEAMAREIFTVLAGETRRIETESPNDGNATDGRRSDSGNKTGSRLPACS